MLYKYGYIEDMTLDTSYFFNIITTDISVYIYIYKPNIIYIYIYIYIYRFVAMNLSNYLTISRNTIYIFPVNNNHRYRVKIRKIACTLIASITEAFYK